MKLGKTLKSVALTPNQNVPTVFQALRDNRNIPARYGATQLVIMNNVTHEITLSLVFA